jgi:ribosome-binding protein aMBF1 (putative translation factor)
MSPARPPRRERRPRASRPILAPRWMAPRVRKHADGVAPSCSKARSPSRGRTKILPLRRTFVRGRVALLGIAQRRIRITFGEIPKGQDRPNPLPMSIKTIGGWIRDKRNEKNLTPGHLAKKMGIAAAVVLSWESDAERPNGLQCQLLERFLGLDSRLKPTSPNA